MYIRSRYDASGFKRRPSKKINQVDVNYLYYYFLSVSKRIIDAGTGATVQGVKIPFILNLDISLPSIDNQKNIVELLNKTYSEIKNKTTQNKKEELHQLRSSILTQELKSEAA